MFVHFVQLSGVLIPSNSEEWGMLERLGSLLYWHHNLKVHIAYYGFAVRGAMSKYNLLTIRGCCQ